VESVPGWNWLLRPPGAGKTSLAESGNGSVTGGGMGLVKSSVARFCLVRQLLKFRLPKCARVLGRGRTRIFPGVPVSSRGRGFDEGIGGRLFQLYLKMAVRGGFRLVQTACHQE
jgi:hypothetical protein